MRSILRHPSPVHGERFRNTAIALLLLGGLALFGAVAHRHYPIQHWFVWRVLGCWLLCGVLSFACLSSGLVLVRRLFGSLPSGECLVLGLAFGFYVFVFGLVVAGFLGCYHQAFALGWPIALCLPGIGSLSRSVDRRIRRAMTRTRRPWSPAWTEPDAITTTTVVRMAAMVFGAGTLALIYFTILTPANVGFDAAWYHLAIAERYAVEAAIRPFPEGSYLAAYPHWASVLYSWAFVLARGGLFNQVLLSAHLEFTVFLWTLASVPVLVRRLVPGARSGWTWAVTFLFPGITLYDSSLCLEADHVLAFFAIPIYLAFLRARSSPTSPRIVGLALAVSGALLTKYSSILLLVGPSLGIVWNATTAVCRAVRRQRTISEALRPARDLALGGMLLGLATLLFTTPHWLKNWLWHGDPIYPFLARVLPAHPWTEDAQAIFDNVNAASGPWRPEGSLQARLLETVRALATFSFEPHDWMTYHGTVPVFGSLFTLLLLALPLVRGTRRVLELSLFTLAGVFLWYWRCHQDRYLQAILPWMVGTTAALIVLLWRRGGLVRVPLVGLVILQVVWGGDVCFIPAADDHYEHSRMSPIQATADLLAGGHRRDYEGRFRKHLDLLELRPWIPSGARVLFHERYLVFGLGVPVSTDLPGWQGGISYATHRSAESVARLLSGMGMTHVIWETVTSRGQDSFLGDLRFFDFLVRCTGASHQVGALAVAPIVPCEHAQAASEQGVLFADCNEKVKQGVYDWDDFGRLHAAEPGDPVPLPRRPSAGEIVEGEIDAPFVVFNRDCRRFAGKVPSEWQWFHRGPYDIVIKKPSAKRADLSIRR